MDLIKPDRYIDDSPIDKEIIIRPDCNHQHREGKRLQKMFEDKGRSKFKKSARSTSTDFGNKKSKSSISLISNTYGRH